MSLSQSFFREQGIVSLATAWSGCRCSRPRRSPCRHPPDRARHSQLQGRKGTARHGGRTKRDRTRQLAADCNRRESSLEPHGSVGVPWPYPSQAKQALLAISKRPRARGTIAYVLNRQALLGSSRRSRGVALAWFPSPSRSTRSACSCAGCAVGSSSRPTRPSGSSTYERRALGTPRTTCARARLGENSPGRDAR